jgi:hypothetical protein
MIQTQKGQKPPVKAKLLIAMKVEVNGEVVTKDAGDIVELKHRDFVYLESNGRVEAAPAKKEK